MAAENYTSFAVIILAAGESSRLGKPKQLFQYEGQTLIQHCVHAACQCPVSRVVVILGAYADEIKEELSNRNYSIHITINEEWREGMASSIRNGIKAVQHLDSATKAIIIMVCDQPFCTTDLLKSLIAKHNETGKPIVGCSYVGTVGSPTLFHQSLFQELLQLTGPMGAKDILRKHPDLIDAVPFEKGALDIDTLEDYQKLISKNVD